MFSQVQLKEYIKMSTSLFSQVVAACCVVGVMTLTGCGATAPTQGQATAAPAQAVAASKGETVCKREVVIGSYFPIRVCKTVEEWERDSRGVERAQDDIARGVGSATPKQ